MRTAWIPLVAVGLTLAGCATKGYVNEQIAPIENRLASVEAGLQGAQGDISRMAAAMQNLELERSFVLDMKEGANFAFGSAALQPNAKTEISRFMNELRERETTSGETNSSRFFVVAGHTDNSGPEDLNYELAQKRASKVAAYLVAEEGVEPISISAVSYGESKPIAENSSLDGRRRNRRVEILVYGEQITSR